MPQKPRILVTTANGRTGSATVEELLRLGHPVRAMVRTDDRRAATWRQKGAEVVVGNLADYRDLCRALDGVQRAYHCPPFDSNHLHHSMLFALAAEESGVEVVALMSGWNPHPSHPSILQRDTWVANNLYRRMPSFDVIHINPGMFAFTYLLGLPMIVHFGMLAGPWGDGRNAPPSNEDIGAIAAHALVSPKRYVGRFLRPMGPELLSPSDIASKLSRVVGREVTYRDVPASMLRKSAAVLGFPRFQIAQVQRYVEELRRGAFAQEPNDHVLEVTGRAPEAFESIAERYIAEPHRIVPGLEVGSFLSALWLGVEVALSRDVDLAAWEKTRDYTLIEGGQLAHESPAWSRAAKKGELALLPFASRAERSAMAAE